MGRDRHRSGFGGSVTACRLAERGLKVLVLERGRRWTPDAYPRDPGDAWTFDVGRPEKHNGWIDLRILDDMIVVQGAGVGGGSLIYANVSIEPKRELFANGWPAEITSSRMRRDRKSTRLNSSHLGISYAVFCLEKNK